jgi:hypothetical protein
MSAFDAIGQAGAAGVLATAVSMGTRISLQHRSGTAATLYAEILSQAIGGMRMRGAGVEEGTLVVMIPVQSGFAVMTGTTRPVTVGDRIEYPLSSGRYFWIDDDTDIEQLDNGYVFKVQAHEHKTGTVGILS